MRVLHVSQPTDAGVARCVVDAARDQVARGWEVAVACPVEGALAGNVRDAGAEVLTWRAARAPGPGLARETARLRSLVDAWGPELVHLHSSKAGLCGRLVLRGRRTTVFQPHGWSFFPLRGAYRRAAVAWERLAARWAHVTLCVSEGERQAGEQEGLRASWRVVPNGVDLTAFTPAGADEALAARRRLGLPEGAVVACVGRLSHQKGQDVLLGAWPLVLARIPNTTLALVGNGPTERSLRASAGGGVLFAGARRDVAEWLAAADVVTVPSRWEGMSLTMLEAMACGRSVVATDVAGAREALAGAGAVVPVEAREALARALVERLLDPELRAEEGREARRRAEASYDVRGHVAAVAELYEELAAGAQ